LCGFGSDTASTYSSTILLAAMGSEVSSPSKRNRDKESNLGDDHSSGVNDEHCEIAYSSQLEVDAGYTSNRNQGPDVLPYKASILSSCRAALVKSPAASRAALARHRGTVDPELIKILETIGSFKDEVISIFLSVYSCTCVAVQFSSQVFGFSLRAYS